MSLNHLELIVIHSFFVPYTGDPDDFNRLTSSGLVNLFSPMFEADIKPFGSRVHVISDLVTTISRPFALLRPVNYLLASFLFRILRLMHQAATF